VIKTMSQVAAASILLALEGRLSSGLAIKVVKQARDLPPRKTLARFPNDGAKGDGVESLDRQSVD